MVTCQMECHIELNMGISQGSHEHQEIKFWARLLGRYLSIFGHKQPEMCPQIDLCKDGFKIF